VPIIHRYIELIKGEGIYLVLMQDSAPSYAARETKDDLKERGIIVIFWPLFSLDLNPIERVWHIIKNYLQDHYPETMGYDQLRLAVQDAWNKVGQFEFEELIKSMPDRCRAVIAAEGKFTQY
jgi:transposase